jgi:thiol-disulfide isomerase/thioredoxin
MTRTTLTPPSPPSSETDSTPPRGHVAPDPAPAGEHAKAPVAGSARLHQHGLVSRRALLTLVGLSAAVAGAWLAGRQLTQGERGKVLGAGGGNGPASATAAQTAPATPAASAPVIEGDTLTASFWAQQFDTPVGPPLALSAFKGKPLLINFWATWCPPCVKELPELDRFAKEFGAQGWQALGLAIDGPTPVREFLTKVKVGLPVGLAGFGGTELAAALGNEAGGLPFSVMIDAQGRVLHRKMGATTFDELAAWARAAATH